MSGKPKPSHAEICDLNAARAARAVERFEQILAKYPHNEIAIGMRDFHQRDVRFWERRAAEYRGEF